MKQTLLFFIFTTCALHFLQAQRSYEDIPGDSIQLWTDERVDHSLKGNRETVQIPFVIRSLGWGCMCPMHFMGSNVGTHDGPWLSPVFPKDFPETDEAGKTFVVTGYFTGEWATEDYRDENGEPEEWLYKIPIFVITQWQVNDQENIPAPKILENNTTGKNPKKKKKKKSK